MNQIIRSAAVGIITLILVSPLGCQAGAPAGRLTEDAALDLLQRTLERDYVYEK